MRFWTQLDAEVMAVGMAAFVIMAYFAGVACYLLFKIMTRR